LISENLRRAMYSWYLSASLVGRRNCKTHWLFQQQRQHTWLEALWLRGLIETIDIIHDSVQIYCDSKSVIHLIKKHIYHKRTKHIVMRYHKIRQWVIDVKVNNLVKINTKRNLANMMIMVILVEKFRASLNFIQVLHK